MLKLFLEFSSIFFPQPLQNLRIPADFLQYFYCFFFVNRFNTPQVSTSILQDFFRTGTSQETPPKNSSFFFFISSINFSRNSSTDSYKNLSWRFMRFIRKFSSGISSEIPQAILYLIILKILQELHFSKSYMNFFRNTSGIPVEFMDSFTNS